MSPFSSRYGPWAVVAGASEGLGAAFAHALAARKLNLLLLARRTAVLDPLVREIQQTHGVEAMGCTVDLGTQGFEQAVLEAVGEREVGLLVYNAGHSAVGPFLDQPLEEQLRSVDVNCRGPLILAHTLGRKMVARGQGGIVLMSSLTAFQGSPYVSAYGATKAFNLSLGEGLWFELRERGVDVLAVCAGAISTPNMMRVSPDGAPGILPPRAVVEQALAQLGKRPWTIPGTFNRLASFFMRRFLSRRATVSLMGGQTRQLKPSS